jgi:uncharacterized protein YraI
MRNVLFLSMFCLLLGACSGGAPEASATPAPLFFTATLAPTSTDRASSTPAPPTIAPTIEPVEGLAKSQLNVRSGPDQGQPSLGLLDYFSKLSIIGKDPTGKWWEILYKDSPTGTGWVTAAFVDLKGDPDKIPVIAVVLSTAAPQGTPGAPADAAGTVPPPTTAPRTAKVTKMINVRSGPASANSSLGMLDPNTTVTITGRNQQNTWVQIEYPSGANGKGWVAAAYLNNPNLTGLPYYDNDGNPVSVPGQGNGSGQNTTTPTPYSEAPEDNDSAQSPAVRQVFSPDGASVLTYSSDLSSPSGDAADWVAFTPYGPSNQSTYVYMRLDCTGNGGITAILMKDGTPVPYTKQLLCGVYGLAMKVLGSQEYVLVLRADPSGGPVRYVKYTLTIKVAP